MLKHKKNCTQNLVTIQHRFLQGVNGDRRVLHRLYCPNCKNSCTVGLKEAWKFIDAKYPDISPEQWEQIQSGGIIDINAETEAQQRNPS